MQHQSIQKLFVLLASTLSLFTLFIQPVWADPWTETSGPIDHFMEPDLTTKELLALNERWGLGEAFRDTYYQYFMPDGTLKE